MLALRVILTSISNTKTNLCSSAHSSVSCPVWFYKWEYNTSSERLRETVNCLQTEVINAHSGEDRAQISSETEIKALVDGNVSWKLQLMGTSGALHPRRSQKNSDTESSHSFSALIQAEVSGVWSHNLLVTNNIRVRNMFMLNWSHVTFIIILFVFNKNEIIRALKGSLYESDLIINSIKALVLL